jgi:iron complex transport system substrate-binding protein
VAELVQAAGGEFIGTPGRQISFGDISKLDPEVIVAACCGAGDRVPLGKIIASRAWQQTAAALAGSVFCIRDEYLNTPAPTLLQGLDALLFAIHAEVLQGSNTASTKGIRQITAVPGSQLKNSLV